MSCDYELTNEVVPLLAKKGLMIRLSLFRLVRRARRERNPRKKMAARDPGGGKRAFFRVSLDGLSERGTTRLVSRTQFILSESE